MINKLVKRGDIFYADLGEVKGSEQGGIRPVIIIQNDVGNRFSPCVIIAAITSQINKAKLPTHVELSAIESGLPKDSVVLLEQIRTLDKIRLKEYVGNLPINGEIKNKVDMALLTSVGLQQMFNEKSVVDKARHLTSLQNLLDLKEIKQNEMALENVVGMIKAQYDDLKRYCDEYRMDIKKYYNPQADKRLAM